jgi:hypothetical protein
MDDRNMWRKHPHRTDEELLRAADGELSLQEAAVVQGHLAKCSTCRARFDQIQQAAYDFVQAYRREQDTAPPARDSRAQLQALLKSHAKEPAPSRRFAPASGPLAGWTWVHASFAALLACVALYWSPHFHRPLGAKAAGMGSEHALLVPIPNLTPGAARPITASQACVAGPLDQMSSIPLSVRQQVFHEYGMDDAPSKQYEVDHLITPELGGTDDIQNLWPEPYSSEWNARVKDQLEDHLRELVCEGKLDVSTAQREIATDWISAYKKYFQTDRPRPSSQG